MLGGPWHESLSCCPGDWWCSEELLLWLLLVTVLGPEHDMDVEDGGCDEGMDKLLQDDGVLQGDPKEFGGWCGL
jgi:hypothetical protein